MFDYVIEKTETNPFASRELAGNGGGYSQPLTVLRFADGVRVEVEDTSCGDFGSRYWVSLYQGDAEVGRARWGSMLRKDEEFSSISAGAFGSHLKAVEEALGLHVLTAEDICRR